MVVQQKQKQRELPPAKIRLHPLELVLGWLSLLFGSAGFLYFWMAVSPRQPSWYAVAARVALLLGVLLVTLAGGLVLCRARLLARWLLHGAGLFAVLVLGFPGYTLYGAPPFDYHIYLIAIAGIAAATFWIFWFAWFLKKQESET